MKKYNVTVNGTKYEITLEIADGASISTPVATNTIAAPTPAPAAPAQTGGTSINAPMPGTILAVNVQNGSTVKKGDVLFILEAMKMENEIMSPCEGTISSLDIQNGASVETGALLCVIG